jgi:hypothetical protein
MHNRERDIRRSLPEYQTREGDVVYNAPYRATSADLNAFVLHADTKALQALLDAELNECVQGQSLLGSQRRLRFTSAEPWIVLIYAAFRSFSSTNETDRREGRDHALELGMWIPAMKEQVVSGVVTVVPAWYLALVYTAPTASVATGREVYGYPKIPAYLEVPDEGGPPVAVQLREEFEHESPGGTKKETSRHFCVPKIQTPSKLGWNVDLNRNPLLATIVNRYLANHPIIFRKQVGMLEERDPKGVKRVVAGYTALIECRVPVTQLSNLNSINEDAVFTQSIEGFDPELARRLGVKSLVPQFGVALRECRLDIQHGREIWVSSERREFIKPLTAPGNSLIWNPRPFAARRRESAQASNEGLVQPLDNGEDTVEGVAEAYFGETRRFAIESLLSRHFPAHLPNRPTVDPQRDFVMFMFVRAEADAAVRLYEVNMAVPVYHEGRPAWYIAYSFRSPGAAVIQARQRFGHPCQEGFVKFKDASTTRSLLVRRPVSRGRLGMEWVRQEGIKFEKLDDQHSARVVRDEEARAALATEVEPVVGLLQFRHAADTTRACFQEIVRSRRKFVAGAAPKDTGHWKVTLPGELRFGRLLDLNGNSQIVRGYRFDKVTISTTAWTLQGRKRDGIGG